MLELVWQQDATASVFTRDPGGVVSAARSLDVRELIRLAETAPADAGGSAAAIFAVVELAHRSVSEGLVHPYLEHAGGSWHAFWGATLDERVQATLDELAVALPVAAAAAFGGDRDATVRDLYPVLVDQIARDRLREGRVRLGATLRNGRPTALELFLDGLSSPEPEVPRHAGYAALNRRLSRWLDDGLGRRSSAPWKLGLHLDERGTALALELWLHAEDDPTLALPAALLHEEGDEVFSFLRASDPRRDLARQLTEIEPLLAEHGIRFDEAEPAEAELDADEVPLFLREAMPLLEARGVPVLLPGAWLGGTSRLRVNLTATSSGVAVRSSGLLSTAALATFDWRLSVGDVDLSEQELADLAAAKQPFVHVAGRWHALRRSDVEKALRFLERRRTGAGIGRASGRERVFAVV